MAKVIYSMTAGIGQDADYTAPTGDTPISLGEIDIKNFVKYKVIPIGTKTTIPVKK